MLWPRSLFVRTTLLFSSILFVSYIAAIVLFLVFFIKPISISTASYLSQQIISIRQATQGMSEAQTQTYLTALALQENILLYSNKYPTTLPGSPAADGFQRGIATELKNRLAQSLQVRFQFGPEKRIVWLNFDNKHSGDWLGVRLSAEANQFPNSLKAQLLVILILTMLGSSLLAYRINRPLKKLVNAAQRVSRGEFPEPLPVQGPQELRDLSETFNTMVRDISKLADDRNLMLAGISHDLRTPLARMRLAIEMLGDNTERELRQGLICDLDDMDRILGQFISFSRQDTDEITQSINLNDLIREVAEHYSQQDKPLVLQLDDIPLLPIKPVAMRRLLANLIDNAWYYAQPPVCIATHLINGSSVELIISDNGPGIAAEKIQQLLQPFARLDNARGDGLRSGLGLAIVKRIAQAMQIQLDISNRASGGLQVKLTLPLQ